MIDIPHLPLQIASGILIAYVVLWLCRSTVNILKRKDYQMGIPALLLSAALGGGLVLAGLGMAPY